MGAPKSVSFDAHSLGPDEVARERRGRVSLLRYSPALVLAAVAVADAIRYADPDLWGHVKFGQAVLALHHPIFRDPYSYSAPGHPFLDHEWLSDAIIAAIYNHFGVIGLKLMKFAAAGATVVLLALGMAETGAPTGLQAAILLAAAVAISPQIEFRPQSFTFALLSAVLWMLARHNYRRRAHLWLVVPMFALWANLHGGFIMGLAALGIYGAVVMAQDLAAGRGAREGARLFAITSAATLATLATPYGIANWQGILHALSNPYTRIYVHDWRSLATTVAIVWRADRFQVYPFAICALTFLALAAAFATSPRGGDLPLVAIAAVMIAAAVAAERNVAIAVIACTIPLARHATLAIDAWRARRGSPPIQAEAAPMAPARQLIVAAAALALVIGGGLFSPRLLGSAVPYPQGAIEFMRAHHLEGNIFADFGWGDYVIFHLCPPSHVFMDGRYDTVYPADVVRDDIRAHTSASAMREVIAKYPHDFVLISPTDEKDEYDALLALPGWTRIYLDGTCALFARAGTPAASIAPVTRSAKDTPTVYFP
jgi:hypothetical protein